MAVINASNIKSILDELYEAPGNRSKKESYEFFNNWFKDNTDPTVTKFFTKDNFKEFWEWLIEKKPFASYDETKQNAGLELIEAEVTDDKFHARTPETNDLEQGKYYWSSTPVSGLHIYPYKPLDNKIMGESIIQFKTGEAGFSEWEDDINPLWVTENKLLKPTFKPNSNYQIRLTTDQEGTYFAYVNRYETADISDIQKPSDPADPESLNTWIEVVYYTPNTSLVPFNTQWLRIISNSVVKHIYYSQDGTESYSEVSLASLLEKNQLISAGPNPKILIEFSDSGEITLASMFRNVSISSFKICMDAKRITSMSGMFAVDTSTTTANYIDLTGIYNSISFKADSGDSHMFTSLFQGRKINDTDGTALKLFGKDADGKATGINTSRATSLSNMFGNGPLSSVHCNPNLSDVSATDENDYKNGPFNIIRGLDVRSCIDFSHMFAGCKNIKEINLAPWYNVIDENNQYWGTRINNLINFGAASSNSINSIWFNYMFSNTGINDESLKNINNFLIKISRFSENNFPIYNYNLDGIFKSCPSITNGGEIDLVGMFKDDKNLKTVSFRNMFEGCGNLDDTPLIEFTRAKHPELNTISMEYMFKGCGANRNTLKFTNISNWLFDYPGKGIAPMPVFKGMFQSVPLYKLQTNNGNVFNFCSNQSNKKSRLVNDHINYGGPLSIVMVSLDDMFKDTVGTSGKSYHINFNLDLGSYNMNNDTSGIVEYDYEYNTLSQQSFYNMDTMLDENNKGKINIWHDRGVNAALYYALSEKVYKNKGLNIGEYY